MSTDQLGTALRDLVDEVEVALAPPPAADLWAGGRRRRRASRLAPLVAVACVAVFMALLVWPTGSPHASVPSVSVQDGAVRLTSYPDVIAKPPSIRETTTPGVTAALIPGVDQLAPGYAVSPVGVVTRVRLPRDESGLNGEPSLSPDGRWVARGPVLTNLVSGSTVPSTPEQVRLGRAWTPPEQPSWWSPDSGRVFVGAFNQGTARFAGIVVGTDGSVTQVPLPEENLVPLVAGWLDDDTLLAFLDVGPDEVRLQGRTWSIGEDAWQPTSATVPLVQGTEALPRRLQLSPDRTRLLVAREEVDLTGGSPDTTLAMMFDPLTGKVLGMPGDDGILSPSSWDHLSYAGWEGWGCRSAWRDGLPVITDGEVRGFVDTSRDGVVDGKAEYGLVGVSSGFGQPCLSFAGDELRGAPVTNHVAVWQERLWNGGIPLLALALVVGVTWWWARRRKMLPPRRRPWLPAIITRPF